MQAALDHVCWDERALTLASVVTGKLRYQARTDRRVPLPRRIRSAYHHSVKPVRADQGDSSDRDTDSPSEEDQHVALPPSGHFRAAQVHSKSAGAEAGTEVAKEEVDSEDAATKM